MPKSNPRLTSLPAWQKLLDHYDQISGRHMRDLFAEQADRFNDFSIHWEEFLLDYSKNLITKETKQLLMNLARECKVPEAIESMFKGEKINTTENREVLHTALRSDTSKPFVMLSIVASTPVTQVSELRQSLILELADQILVHIWL